MREWLGEDPYIAGRRQGKVEIGALAAGQSSAVIREVLPAAEIVRRLREETLAALSGAHLPELAVGPAREREAVRLRRGRFTAPRPCG